MTDLQASTDRAQAVAGLRGGDIGFFAALFLVLLLVAWCGWLVLSKGMQLEATKANGQALAAWAEQLAQRKALPLTLASCTSVAAGDSPALEGQADWASCRQALLAPTGPLAHLSNPFNPMRSLLGERCERKNPALRGVVTLEKGTSAVPGLPSGVVWTPLADADVLAPGMLLRVLACDSGGVALKIAELRL